MRAVGSFVFDACRDILLVHVFISSPLLCFPCVQVDDCERGHPSDFWSSVGDKTAEIYTAHSPNATLFDKDVQSWNSEFM